MALFVAIVAIGLIISGINNTWADLGAQLKFDLTGSGSFIYWLGALVLIGFVSFIPGFRTPVRMLLALIILVFVLKNGSGFFSNLQTALQQGPQAPPAADTNVNAPSGGIPVSVNLAGGGNTSGGIGNTILKSIPLLGGLL
jgi:type III secretory pathway component EscV